MKYFVHMSFSWEDEQLIYFVSDDFNKAPRDEQGYSPCVLYKLRNIIFQNSDQPENYFYSYNDENDIEELMYNGPVDYIVDTLNERAAVIQTLFENDGDLIK